MHTSEQATTLWCPMARVAQSGETDINTSYNRTLSKKLIPLKLQVIKDAEDFELGDEPTTETEELVLRMKGGLSLGASCLGQKCAAWRWHQNARPDDDGTMVMGDESPAVGYCGMASVPQHMV